MNYENPIELRGSEPGPISLIFAGIHGNEICGILAFEKLIPTLTIEKGTVIFAYGNPRAIEQNVRFTEVNLNRLFKSEEFLSDTEKNSYEYERAQVLKTYMNRAEVLLDIHASNTPDSPQFIISNKTSRDIAKYLPFPLVVTGLDEIEPGGTESYMTEQGKIGIAIECGYAKDPNTALFAEESIMAFLITQGHISGEKKSIDQKLTNMDYLYHTKTNFVLMKEFKDFESVHHNQLIGYDGDTEVTSPKDGVILFARNRNGSNEEGFLIGA